MSCIGSYTALELSVIIFVFLLLLLLSGRYLVVKYATFKASLIDLKIENTVKALTQIIVLADRKGIDARKQVIIDSAKDILFK